MPIDGGTSARQADPPLRMHHPLVLLECVHTSIP
jgi:hypothetical protein